MGAKRRKLPSWTKKFLARLADSSNVSSSARHAKIDPSTAYRLRRDNSDFERAWQEALYEGYNNLEMELLGRMREGELKPAAGAKRGRRTFDNAIGLRLLAAHREAASRQRAARAHVSAAEVRASIDAKITAMRKRVEARKRAEEDAKTDG